MKVVILIYFFICLCSIVLGTSEDEYEEESPGEDNEIDGDNNEDNSDFDSKVPTSNCWMKLNSAEHFQILDDIDARYATVRKEVQEALKENEFDKAMIDGFKRERGVALREQHASHHQAWMIPSGMNLGGLCMLRMPNSILFFHRMKLRNNTYFRVDWLYNDIADMVVRINLSLNDLHLQGAYERALTDHDPSVLIYAPTFGQIEFLLKDVKYKMEGRYRMIKNRLLIELVSSELRFDEALMTYINQAIESSALNVKQENLGSYIGRLKTDLDKWVKDYFNDYMIYADMSGIPHMDELSKYDKEKGRALEEFTDNSINAIVTRIHLLNAETVRLPTFTIKSFQGTVIKMYEGVLNGLDSMYRRSVATGYKQNNIRKVDSVVGFSNLKVVYKYEAMIPTGLPPLSGVLRLSANELTAHLALSMIADPETIDLDFQFLDQMKPESLTVEGAASIIIANFKHILEHQIVAIMSNTLVHGVVMLKSLPRCEPFAPGQIPGREHNKHNKLSDWHASDASESEEILRGRPRKYTTRHPEPLNNHSNIIERKKKLTKKQKYLRKRKTARPTMKF